MARKWSDINKDSLTAEDWAEINLQVQLVGAILDARKDAGITQAELEEICGVKQTHIARIENNRTDPQLHTVLKILAPLGKTLAVVDMPPAGEQV
ncbi:MAG: helix-turn-helix transcriptional regulator [Clostridiales bacterium]|jgi:transcriptional regulator with XRE-family HTH domain|nr:helix-turn-helix transcriptional regulator [Clostridiales bacterium]